MSSAESFPPIFPQVLCPGSSLSNLNSTAMVCATVRSSKHQVLTLSTPEDLGDVKIITLL